MNPKNILITGASGFIGQALCKSLIESGFTPIALVRDPIKFTKKTGIQAYTCNLPHELDPSILSLEYSVIIHAAYDMRFQNEQKSLEINVNGTCKLLETLKKPNTKMVFISSMSAHQNALSTYGKTKFNLESLFNFHTDLIIRPGLVIGNGGLFERMIQSIKKLRLIPIFLKGNQPLHIIHINDLCKAITLSIQNQITGELNLGTIEPITLTEFYKMICSQLKIKAIFLPVPFNITLFILKLFEKWNVFLPISSENLLGLKTLKKFDTLTSWNRLSLKPEPIQKTLENIN